MIAGRYVHPGVDWGARVWPFWAPPEPKIATSEKPLLLSQHLHSP